MKIKYIISLMLFRLIFLIQNHTILLLDDIERIINVALRKKQTSEYYDFCTEVNKHKIIRF